MRPSAVLLLASLSWLGLALLFGPRAAMAAGCEGISNAFAYNECLSKQAPPRATRGVRRSGGDPEASVVQRRSGAGRRARGARFGSGRHGVSILRSRGRVHATIDPWSGLRGKSRR